MESDVGAPPDRTQGIGSSVRNPKLGLPSQSMNNRIVMSLQVGLRVAVAPIENIMNVIVRYVLHFLR